MQELDKELLAEYSNNNRLLNSVDDNVIEKAAAGRRMDLLENRSTLMSSYDAETHRRFLQYGAKVVDKLLGNYSVTRQDEEENALELSDDNFEGFSQILYEENACDEITVREMQLLGERPKEEDCKKSTNIFQTRSVPNSQSAIRKFLEQKSTTKACQSSKEGDLEMPSGSKEMPPTNNPSPFRTAREEYLLQNFKKYGEMNSNRLFSTTNKTNSNASSYFNYGATKNTQSGLRSVRRGAGLSSHGESSRLTKRICTAENDYDSSSPSNSSSQEEPKDSRLANIDQKMIELIKSEIMNINKAVDWNDIAGLAYVKTIIKETVVFPLLRPDIFTGIRRPPRAILLFGPPGTGKTLIGKCIASQSGSTFFSISASSLTSKWVGDGEKMVRALFAVAAVHQPAIIFIDEVDSLLAKRSETEHDSSRKLKNELLIQLDGTNTSEEDRVIIVGATNRPQELDDAARRRFARRLYIPMPECNDRIQILRNIMQTVKNTLDVQDINRIGQLTDGYSGADIDILCREASLRPVRMMPIDEMLEIKNDDVRPVNIEDFEVALQNVRPSICQDDLVQYIKWNGEYGSKV